MSYSSPQEMPVAPATVATSAQPAREPQADVALLQRMVQGDSAALGQFYDLHAGMLLGLACRILQDVKEAEDVLQEVFVQLWDRAAAFDPGQGRPLAWVLTLTRHKAIDRL